MVPPSFFEPAPIQMDPSRALLPPRLSRPPSLSLFGGGGGSSHFLIPRRSGRLLSRHLLVWRATVPPSAVCSVPSMDGLDIPPAEAHDHCGGSPPLPSLLRPSFGALRPSRSRCRLQKEKRREEEEGNPGHTCVVGGPFTCLVGVEKERRGISDLRTRDQEGSPRKTDLLRTQLHF